MAKGIFNKLSKRPLQSVPVEAEALEKPGRVRGSVQTVRMDEELVRALKQASIDRNLPQQTIITQALRRDLGLSL